MGNTFEHITGQVRIEVCGARPERVMNVMSSRGVSFRRAEKISEDRLAFSCTKNAEKAAIKAAQECGMTVTELKKSGALFFAQKLKKRAVLLAAAFAVIIAAYYMSLFVWEVRVEGNQTVPSGEIRAALEQSGYGIGCFGPAADREYAASFVRMTVGKLSWVGINIRGCVMTVIVRERREPPDIIAEKDPCDIAAAKTGVITSFDDFSGRGLADVGDTVLKGQRLVSGEMPDLSGGVRYVHSTASVKARTWYVLSAVMPLSYGVKDYTGIQKEKNALILGDLRINLYLNSRISEQECDNIIYDERGMLFGNYPLPVMRRVTIAAPYETVIMSMPEYEAEALLRERLERRLKSMLAEGEIVDMSFESISDGNAVTVVMRAECLEEIACEAPLQKSAAREEASNQ